MAEELRLALILLGSLAIGAVVLHGIWTVRKNVQDQRPTEPQIDDNAEEANDEDDQEIRTLKIKQMEMDFNTLTVEDESEGLPVVDMDVDSIYHHDDLKQASANSAADFEVTMSSSDLSTDEDLPTFSALDTPIHQELEQGASYSEQATENTKVHFEHPGDDNHIVSSETVNNPNLNQQQTESSIINSKDTQAATQKSAEQKPKRDPEVLILFVDKPEGEMIDGAKLLPLLLTLGFKFGEMDFFHRHEQTSGHGEILFSLANMYNPGTFDIDHMEQVQTRGLSIFMTMPNAGEALQTFNMMHNAAKKIADEFDARVLDYKREPLDVVRVRHYVEKIRKF